MVSLIVILSVVGFQERETWNDLVPAYQELGLPTPPKDAVIVYRVDCTGSINGEEYENFKTAVATPAPRGQWVLLGKRKPESRDQEWEVLPPTEVALDKLQTRMGRHGSIEFDPLFAIQATLMKRAQLIELAESSNEGGSRHFEVFHPRNVRRHRLAESAWDYWLRQFAVERGDQRPIVVRLEGLLAPKWGLDSKPRRNVIADMKLTLEKRPASVDPHKALIEKLLDAEIDLLSWQDRARRDGWAWRPTFDSHVENDTFQALLNGGLDAVPALVDHLEDFRLTRSLRDGSGGRVPRNIRVADVVAAILWRMAPEEEFHYEMRDRDGRGVVVDRNHVLDWLKRAKAKGERETFLAEVIDDESKSDPIRLSHLRVIAMKHPSDFPPVYRRILTLPKLDWQLDEVFDLLRESKLSKAEKTALLEEAIKSDDPDRRAMAIAALMKLDRAAGVPRLVKELDAVDDAIEQEPMHRLTLATAEADHPELWKALERAAERVSPTMRVGMLLGVAARSRNPAAIPFWEKFLDDKERGQYRGPCSSDQLADYIVRNLAAEKIALAWNWDAKTPTTDAGWEELHRTVRAELDRKRGGGK